MRTDPSSEAELIRSIHQPRRASLDECLRSWRALDPAAQAQSYLVLRGDAGMRRTLNGRAIAELAAHVPVGHG